MKIAQLQRRRTRRQRLTRRLDDVVGRACWMVTAWYGRRLRAELLRRARG